MSSEYQWDKVQQASILGAFFWGYASSQIIGGKLCTVYGADRVLVWAVLAWSLCTMLTPLASASVPLLLLNRVLMGLGEGMSQPAIHGLVSQWVPLAERTRCIALATSGQIIGTVLSMVSSPVIKWWWQGVFYFYGMLGFAWAGWASFDLAGTPAASSAISRAELEYIQRHMAEPGAKNATTATRSQQLQGPSIATLLSTPAFLAIVVVHFAHNWGWYILISWVPTYVNHTS